MTLNMTNIFFKNNGKCKNENSLELRMKSYINRLNNVNCHYYKPHIISIKSKQLLKYINNITELQDKIVFLNDINNILVNVSKLLFNRFSPHMIYTFHNEINLVFYYNDGGDYLYNGNITKILTSITSCASVYITKELQKRDINIDFLFDGNFVEFDKDFETLNYLIWRQFDCKRNTLTLLYKCLYMDHYLNGQTDINNIKLDDMKQEIDQQIIEYDQLRLYKTLLTGNIIKKRNFYKQMDNYIKTDIFRKIAGVENFYFNDNFKDTLERYIKTKVL